MLDPLDRRLGSEGIEEPQVAATAAGGALDAICLECDDAKCDFKPARLQRRPLGPKDVLMEVKYCGVCHSDLHNAADHLAAVGMKQAYPCTPGHEVAGVVEAIGSEVTKFNVGDHIGVGCYVDSCMECEKCKSGEENKCSEFIVTYGAKDKGSGRAETAPKGSHTRGGYSTKLVVIERFGIIIPAAYPLEMAGPVMCAGITVYDPLKRSGAKAGTRVGIIGLGGLGTMGLKLATALGCKVTAISRTNKKEELAKKAGAETYVVSGDPESMRKAAGTLDLILNTISIEHDWGAYHKLLDKGGTQVMLGMHTGTAAAMLAKKPSVQCSVVGGIANTQEVMDLCAKAKIYPEIELKSVDKIKEIFEALDSSNDSGVRYVLDIQGSLNDKAFDGWKGGAPKLNPAHKPGGYCSVVCQVLKIKLLY